MKKINIYLWVIIFGILNIAKTCQAEMQTAGGGFSLAPFYKEINLTNDQREQKFSLQVKNDTDVVAVFHLSVLDFGSLDESGGVAFLGTSNLERKYSLASWLNLEKDGIVVAPHEEQEVQIKIENKESLSPGGHYGAVLLQQESDDESGDFTQPKVMLNQSFASLLFVRKVGGEIYGLKLDSKEIENTHFNFGQKINLRFQNNGNVHVTPRGMVEIFDPLGRKVASGAINTESGIILPETFRKYIIPITKATTLILPGVYTIKISYRYDGLEDYTQEIQKFFLLPIAFLVGVVLLISLILMFLVLRRRKRKI